MKSSLLSFSFLLMTILSSLTMAQQSSITEAEGVSCMGDDKSRKQTESAALQDAKRLAIEFSSSYVESETLVENFELKNDLVKAFAAADVKVLDILAKDWEDPNTGDCFTIKIRAEVIPSKSEMDKVDTAALMGNPRAPLNVKVWTSADNYSAGEAMRIYLQGNKPFYARLIYIDAQGNNIQLLPNQHRRKNYFAGATIFEVPSSEDRFELAIGEPFGTEQLVLYASTEPLGNLSMTAAGDDVYLVTDSSADIPAKTRGISISKPGTATKKAIAEFAEANTTVTTKP